jgi:hypothetical protein
MFSIRAILIVDDGGQKRGPAVGVPLTAMEGG